MLQAKVQNMSNYRYPGGPIFNPFGFGMGVGAGVCFVGEVFVVQPHTCANVSTVCRVY